MPVERQKGTPPKKKNNKGKTKSKSTTPANSNPISSPGRVGSELDALNPPFDPRMRRVGSPLNQGERIRRGWIQTEDGSQRVNFMFNPSSLTLNHALDPSMESPQQSDQSGDVTSLLSASTASSTSVSLLYDRTYEMFNAAQANALATTFGVGADMYAWYTYLKMVENYPADWTNTVFSSPMMQVPSYLFVGPQLVYYGYPTSLTVTISHWSQAMIPQRCKVDVGFQILPKVASNLLVYGPGLSADDKSAIINEGWTGDVSSDFLGATTSGSLGGTAGQQSINQTLNSVRNFGG